MSVVDVALFYRMLMPTIWFQSLIYRFFSHWLSFFFLPVSLANWHIALDKFKMYSVMIYISLTLGMAIHSSILAWRAPWTEEPGTLYSPRGCKESDTTEAIQQKHAHDAKRNVTEDGSFQIKVTIERVTGRKARGLQIEEIACKCQTFLSLLSGRRTQTSNIFSFSIQI